MGRIRKLDGARRKRLRPKLIAMQGGLCCYCCCEFSDNRWSDQYATIEHIQDRVNGGINAQTNLAMACFACNQRAARENWPAKFKLAKIAAANVIALADLVIEPMQLPPQYLARVRAA